VLTSRNSLGWLRGALAERNPDLIASNEGGSNVLLVRPPWRVLEVRHERLARLPERRMLLLARVCLPSGARLVVANAHLSVPATGRGESEVLHAAALATEWAAGDPIVLGGDLNLRPARSPGAFERLEQRFGLVGPTDPHALDHLLAAGLETVERPVALPARAREALGECGLAIRLSDHAPVVAAFRLR
jgi:endonuclease/exonuclease/phosphatase family metal-dependent hydrolase